ncbi:hypothetical protein JCM5350_004423 [Sporobolomyces pararoseus]
MKFFAIASVLALSALAVAQGTGEETSAVDGTEGGMSTMAETPLEGTSSAVDGSAGEAQTASESAIATDVGGVGPVATGVLPDAVQSFTSANGDAIASILSQQAVDPSGAASGARALLSSGYANPEVSSFIDSNPTWSALAAQVTGAGGSTVVDSVGSGSESAASSSSGVVSDASSSASIVTSQVTTTRATVMPTHGAPKSSDPSSTPSSNSQDSENGASSVKFGSTLSITVVASILMITAQ